MTTNTEAREVIAREIDSYIGDAGASNEMAGVVLAALEIEGWQLVRDGDLQTGCADDSLPGTAEDWRVAHDQ